MNEIQLEPVKQILVNELSPDVIYLFGSAAKGNLRPTSDMDLAFLNDQTFEDYDIFMLAQKLADTAKREIDLIQLRKASTVFQAEIISTGKTIYVKNERKKDDFEMLAYKKYAKLNEERQPILDQIKERGSIYG